MVLPKDSVTLPKRPQFFKVLVPNPSSNLRIPTNFRAHLPSELRNTASLLCPHGMTWYVGIHQSGPDIFFQRGWAEFIKAHDLLTGYFLVFKYHDNMKFEVEVFDTTCCLKEYPPKQCTREVPPVIEIEKTSESEDATDDDESGGEIHSWAESLGGETNSAIGEVQRVVDKQNNFQREQREKGGTRCRRPVYIKIEESSDFEGKNCKQSSEIPIDCLGKKRKLSNSSDKDKELFQRNPRVTQMEVQMKKTIKATQSFYSFSQFEKILTRSMVEANMITIPKAFCVKNDLTTNRNIFLKRKIEGQGEVLPEEWRVGLFFGPTESRIRNGWTKFSKENNLEVGERCIFQLISKDTFVVRTVPKNQNKMLSKKNQWRKIGSTFNAKEGEISIIVRQYHLTYEYMHLPLSFCQGNNLTSRRDILLRDLEGKEWQVRFYLNGCKEGRFLGAGWHKFTTDNGLRVGDKCSFKIVTEKIMVVQVSRQKHEE